MSGLVDIVLQAQTFDPGRQLNLFTQAVSGAGAIVSFSGLVRDEGGRLQALEIEHYPQMSEKALQDIATQAHQRWSLERVFILHRYGVMQVGEPIMMVATAARHRGDAFWAAEFLMDFLKSRAPFWKKEIAPSAQTWVEAKDTDETALARWR